MKFSLCVRFDPREQQLIDALERWLGFFDDIEDVETREAQAQAIGRMLKNPGTWFRDKLAESYDAIRHLRRLAMERQRQAREYLETWPEEAPGALIARPRDTALVLFQAACAAYEEAGRAEDLIGKALGGLDAFKLVYTAIAEKGADDE